MSSRLWTDEELMILQDSIDDGMTNREIFESGVLPNRSFRAIKDKRSELAAGNAPLRSPQFVSMDYAKRSRLDSINSLKDIFNIDISIEEIVQLKEDGCSYAEISEKTGERNSYIKNKLESWSTFNKAFDAVFGRSPDLEEVFSDNNGDLEDEYAFEEMWDIFNNWLERKRREIVIPDVSECSDGVSKSLIIQDTHIPFHDEKFLIEIIEKHKNDVDRIIIGGDFLDCYSVSTFPKHKDITLKEELIEGVKVLQYLSESVPEVILVQGNHEERVQKAIHKQLDKNLTFLMQNNILEFISRGFALETIGKELSNVQIINNWYYQLDDAIIGHPSIYSNVALKSAITSFDWFNKWRGRLNLKPFRFLSHAHTHKAGCVYIEGNSQLSMVVETGACCENQDYTTRSESKSKYTPPVNGYVILVQENGVTNINETQLFIQDIYEQK